jgi:hypothetical protein
LAARGVFLQQERWRAWSDGALAYGLNITDLEASGLTLHPALLARQHRRRAFKFMWETSGCQPDLVEPRA